MWITSRISNVEDEKSASRRDAEAAQWHHSERGLVKAVLSQLRSFGIKSCLLVALLAMLSMTYCL